MDRYIPYNYIKIAPFKQWWFGVTTFFLFLLVSKKGHIFRVPSFRGEHHWDPLKNWRRVCRQKLSRRGYNLYEWMLVFFKHYLDTLTFILVFKGISFLLIQILYTWLYMFVCIYGDCALWMYTFSLRDWHPAVVESIVEDRLKLIFIESLDNDGWSTYPAPTSTTPPERNGRPGFPLRMY